MVFMDAKGPAERDLESGASEEEKAALLGEKAAGAEKKGKKGSKKPPRPPRPPKSPSLDAADKKLVREMLELATMKRARMERMRALKKMKNAKAAAAPPNGNFCALVVTVVFCVLIIWQGLFANGSTSVAFHGSPEASAGPSGALISVQFYKNTPQGRLQGSTSASPNNVEHISKGEDPRETSVWRPRKIKFL